ncbi:MAG: transglycosylase domain-containing protein [Actinomycetota bacterium]
MGLLKDFGQIRHRPRDFAKAFLILGVVAPLGAAAAAVAVFYYVPLPASVPSRTAGALAQTSRVYAADGELIASFHAEHNRELIPAHEIPLWLKQAAIASEDERFYQHSGVDLKAISRAAWADVRARATVQGGSTITQQYVKNAYLNSPQRTVFRKVREALVAGQLERTYSKEKILVDYLNTVYLGKGAYGVQAAAKTYFSKPANDLTVSEAAQLVGIIPSPGRFSPYFDPGTAEIRRKFVIQRMAKLRFLDTARAQAALAEKPALAPLKQETFRYPWFVDSVLRQLLADPRYGEAKVFSGGLKIFTTVDPRMQDAAEKTLRETLPNGADPHASLVSIEPKTGYVKAVVGGREYGDQEKFNLALQGRRSPGSSFKTFVLAAALEEGISPDLKFRAPGVLPIKGWGNACQCVHNFGSNGYGSLSIAEATIKSVNTVYAQLAQKVGVAKIVDVAKRMGISSESLKLDERNLAISIGGFTRGVTAFEMASGYATLAAGGIYRKPTFISKIVDREGSVLQEGPAEGVRAIDPGVAYEASKILSEVVKSGTAQRAEIDRPSAGKTGTSQSHNNAWFVGYTPDLSTAIWMGYPKATIPMKLVRGVANVTGGTIPAQMWAAYMRIALAGIPPSEFEVPGQSSSEDGFGLPEKMGPSPSPKPSPTEIPDEGGSTLAPDPQVTPSPTEDSSGLLGDFFGGDSPPPSPQPSPTVTPAEPGFLG